MILKSNNIEQSHNKSRTEKIGSTSSSSSGKKKSARKSGGFLGLLSNQEDSGYGKPDQSTFSMTGAGEMASMSLLPGLNAKHDNNDQNHVPGKTAHNKHLYFSGLNTNSHSASAEQTEVSTKTSALLKNHKAGSDILNEINKLAARLNSGEIKFEKKPVNETSGNPVDLIKNLTSGKGVSAHNINVKNHLDQNHSENITGDGENFNPLDNNIIGGGEKEGPGKIGKTEKRDELISGSKHEKGFAESFLNPGQSQNSIPAGKFKVSSLENYGVYGPDRIQEFGRTVFNIVRNLPGDSEYTAKLMLKPESLGTVFVEISMIDNTASINIKADTSEAARIIENQLPSLKEKLSQQGLEAGRIEVSLSPPDNDLLNHNNGNDAGQTPHEERETRRLYARSFRHLRDRGEIRDFKSYVQD